MPRGTSSTSATTRCGRAWLSDPVRVMLPPAEWPDTAPRARINVACHSDYYDLAAHLYAMGVLATIDPEQIFSYNGRKVTAGIFEIGKSGDKPAGVERLGRLIVNLVPTNAFSRPLYGDVDTLLASPMWAKISLPPGQGLLWTSRDQQGAFYVWRLPAVWHKFLAWAWPVPGRRLGLQTEWAWLAMAVLPMGWLYSVTVFQHIHRRLALGSARGLQPSAGSKQPPAWAEWRKDRGMPLHLAGGLPSQEAAATGKPALGWWQTYIDDFDLAEFVELCCAQVFVGSDSAEALHMDQVYAANDIPTSERKATRRSLDVSRMGARVDGAAGRISNAPPRGLLLLGLLAHCLGLPELPPHALLVLLGKFVREMEFRRPLYSIFQCVWTHARVHAKYLNMGMVNELLHAAASLALCSTDLRARIDGLPLCSDASETGGGWCQAVGLAEHAGDFLKVAQTPSLLGCRPGSLGDELTLAETVAGAARGMGAARAAVLTVGLCDGIAGLPVAVHRLGARLAGHLTSETDPAARRVVRIRWPGAVDLGDLAKIDQRTVDAVARVYSDAANIVVIGAPASSRDLSEAVQRVSLVVAMFRKAFSIPVAWFVETVASIPRDTRDMITELLMVKPVFVCASVFGDVTRPRLFWCSWPLLALPGAAVVEMPSYFKVESVGARPLAPSSWLAPGACRASTDRPLPTFCRRVPRCAPWKPAGLESASEEGKARWAQDHYAYPSYQYNLQHMIQEGPD